VIKWKVFNVVDYVVVEVIDVDVVNAIDVFIIFYDVIDVWGSIYFVFYVGRN
jgi:hypothetical protein